MNSDNFILKIKEHTFILNSQKVMFWKNKSTLLLSDLHIGKGAHAEENFSLLLDNFNKAVNEFNPKRIIILGDLIDASSTLSKELLKEFFNQLKKEIILILGNHDKLTEKDYLKLGISKVFYELKEDMFIFTHKPIKADLLNIHGHLHPGVIKKEKKYPAFYKTVTHFCLPAFGGTTGKNVFQSSKFCELFVIMDNKVKKL